MDKETEGKKKGGNYIQKLQTTVLEQNKTIVELQKQLGVKPKLEPVEPDTVSVKPKKEDYRETMIKIYLAPTGKADPTTHTPVYETAVVKMKDALDYFYVYYANRKRKMISKDNNATIYIRQTGRDLATNRKLTVIKDVPLWIAAERLLEGKLVELVSEDEYWKFYAEREARDKRWQQMNKNILQSKSKEFEGFIEKMKEI